MRRLAATVIAVAAWSGPAHAATCPDVRVPGAEMQKSACLDDLTTAGTTASGHTDTADWGALNAQGTHNPSGVPGLQIDGYFPDTSTINTDNGWHHDSQFVIRLPDHFNGGLVITGAPGVQKQYANDSDIGDWVLDQGFAFASTDKGNSSAAFYQDGEQPGDAIAEWNRRVTELTIAAKDVVRQRYGRAPSPTYVTGVSNGGYLTRWQLENHPELYDGGVDWEGTLFADSSNLFTYLPVALRNYPKYRAGGDQAAHDAMIAAGFAPGSEFLWDLHYFEFWDLTQRAYREELDPDYDGAIEAGIPYCQPGTPDCDADYDWASRPAAVHQALAKVALTGHLGKPMITLHGTLDSLLPIRTDSDVYTRMVDAAGSAGLHRYYVIEDGNHVDSNYDAWPGQLRPILPCWRVAFAALRGWVEKRELPPPSQFVADPHSGDVVNECDTLRAGPYVAGPGPSPATPSQSRVSAARRHARLTIRVSPRRDRRRPFRFHTTGRIALPAGLVPAQACGSGVVSVQVKAGRRTVSTRRAPVRADCTFGSTVAFGGGGRLKFMARFYGNRALFSARAAPRLVRAG